MVGVNDFWQLCWLDKWFYFIYAVFFKIIDSELLIQNYGLNKIIDAISRQMDVSCKTY